MDTWISGKRVKLLPLTWLMIETALNDIPILRQLLF